MKKLLLTLIASFAFCGTILAQHTTFWPEFNPNHYQFPAAFAAFIKIDGTFIEGSDNYADLEIAAYTGDQCRGHDFMDYFPEDGDPHPIVEMSVYYNTGESVPVTFRLYNHSTGVEYTACQSSVEILTGTNHVELYFEYDNAVVLDFTTPPTFTKEITGYTSLTNPAGGYYLIASPIGGINPVFVNSLLDNSYDLYWFNQAGDSEGKQWINYKAGAFNLEPGKGYLYANSQDVTLAFTNNPYVGDGTVHLDYTEGAAFAGWNLVGNPFSVDAYADLSYYVMNDEGTAIYPEPVSCGSAIAPCTGVFVQATATGQDVTFSTTPPESSGAVNNNGYISLVLNQQGNRGGGCLDKATLSFNGNDRLGKFYFGSQDANIYFPLDNAEFAIMDALAQGEMPLNFKANRNGDYTLSISPKGVEMLYLHLVDNMTGADIDLLSNPSYSFNATTRDHENRFKLVFSANDKGNGSSAGSFAYINNGNIVFTGDITNATLQIVDVTGHVVVSSNAVRNVPTSSLAPGVYTLRLINGDNVRVQKMVVE